MLGIAIVLTATCATVADRTETDRDTEAFWAQFQEGDSQINVYNHLRRLVLAYTDENRRSTILQWNPTSSEFTLFLHNVEITDLVTGQDTWGRPTFAGSFDGQGVPHVTGFVDLTPDGQLLVEVAEI